MKLNRYFFRKSQRLVSSEDFERVLKHKCFSCKGIMRLYAAPHGQDLPRFGVSVGKACGNAVIRNRLKRFAREAFRLNQHKIPAGFDYVLIFTQKMTKNKSKDMSKQQNEADWLEYSDIESRFLGMIRILDQQGRLKVND